MRRVTFHGGPLDGETIDWHGPYFRMPVPRGPRYYTSDEAAAASLPTAIAYRTVEFTAYQDDDGRWWYVIDRPVTT